MTHTLAFDHVGITVVDLDAALDFFLALGFELDGRMFMEEEFLDTVCGIPGSRTEVAMVRLPGGGTTLELCRFVRPDTVPAPPAPMANEAGIRNIAFQVDDLHAVVDRLAADGYGVIGGIGEYQGVWRMCYVRGPEGIIVALAQRIDEQAPTG